MEGNHTLPTALAEPLSKPGRRLAQRPVVVVGDRLDTGDTAAHVDRMGPVQEVKNARMRLVPGAVEGLGLLRRFRPPGLGDFQGGDKQAFRVPQCDRLPGLEIGGELLAHVERHRDRPERAPGQPHVAQHARILGRSHESLER